MQAAGSEMKTRVCLLAPDWHKGLIPDYTQQLFCGIL